MDNYEGFTPEEAEKTVAVYVCSQCEGRLVIVENFVAQDGSMLVICPEHGSVESTGMISKTTVAIRNEQGIFQYPKAIRALPDLWGHLIPTRADRAAMLHELGY